MSRTRWPTAVTITVAFVAMFCAGCSCNNTSNPGGDVDASTCSTPCTGDTVCRYDVCVPTPTPCSSNDDCPGDFYCDTTASECLPWGVGPGGENNLECKREPVPGVFFPGAQCEWTEPPAGDEFPLHVNVLATPTVGTFYQQGEFSTPSIVFTAYNFTDGGAQSCIGSDPTNYFGVIRVIDGRTCAQQATISAPPVIASASVALGDLAESPAPEIVAARMDGGLVAFTLRPQGWEVLWQTTSQFADTLCDWAGPSIHDLDDDGKPEVVFYGAVYDGQTGATIDETIAGSVDSIGTGYIPIVADVDGNGAPDLVTGTQLYTWEPVMRRWMAMQVLSASNGHTAVADFGTYPQDAAGDVRGTLDGVAEIAMVFGGIARVYNRFGREIFTANLVGGGGGAVGKGGPPTIADFDGDGRVEFASAGATAYQVLDLDCRGVPDATTCPSLRTDGLAWVQQSQDLSSNTTGSSVFDFDGDARAEVVYGDECYTRVYDGITGKVLYSRFRTSCTWYENPLVVDTDADFNAEIVSTSNRNCNVTCPAIDPIFDGVQCLDDTDCPSATRCQREQPADALGRCRCTTDPDCGGDGFVCLDPIAGPSAAGKVCRASHPPQELAGIRVLADGVDRWVNTRTIWNQHAYSVTNVEDSGRIPKTSEWTRNWTQPGLNNYRQNSPGTGAIPGAIADLTVKIAKVTCSGTAPTVTAQICNRGTEPVGIGMPIAVYAKGPPLELRCAMTTTQRLFPGGCTTLSCDWTGGGGEGLVVVDDRGNQTGTSLECREDNNTFPIDVSCP
ncbi:MAG: VCBS repeat-containing protein [Deltaproteobacteria bacterium]|nr:VCBS repeat-containing protein [Deltaproteobacteria bacterium]